MRPSKPIPKKPKPKPAPHTKEAFVSDHNKVMAAMGSNMPKGGHDLKRGGY